MLEYSIRGVFNKWGNTVYTPALCGFGGKHRNTPPDYAEEVLWELAAAYKSSRYWLVALPPSLSYLLLTAAHQAHSQKQLFASKALVRHMCCRLPSSFCKSFISPVLCLSATPDVERKRPLKGPSMSSAFAFPEYRAIQSLFCLHASKIVDWHRRTTACKDNSRCYNRDSWKYSSVLK